MRVCASISCISMLPPVKKDRVITQLPKCFSANAALHTKEGFHPHVKAACQVQKADTVSFNVAKVIVVGDVAVGKTCLISRWDTAGQERFKCIASTYYRGAQAIIVVFDLSSVGSLAHARQWLEDAMKENDPSSVLLFLVGTKKDLSSPDLLAQIEQEAMRLSEEIKAEYWAVSAKSGDGVKDFFFRVASLTFEANVLSELERSGSRHVGDIIRITDSTETSHKPKKKPNCC
nr:ras-related protein Rab-34 isoform X2 [Maylandia zebra]